MRDKSSFESIYLQIRSQTESAVANGQLAQGDALPGVRETARDLGVNLYA